MRTWTPAVFLGLLLAAAPAEAAPPSDTLRIAVASATGSYYQIAAFACAGLPAEVHCEFLTGEGSVENAQKLASGEADLGILQNDIAYAAQRGLRPFDGPQPGLTAVAMLYSEPILAVSSDPDVTRLRPPAGGPICIGSRGSGLLLNATTILTSAGLWEPEMILYESLSDQEEQFLAGEVWTGFVNSIDSTLQTGIEAGRLSALTMSEPQRTALTSTYSYFVPFDSGIGTDTVRTVAVKAMLAARPEVDESITYAIAKQFYENFRALQATYPTKQDFLSESDLVHRMPLKKWHGGAHDYYQKAGIHLQQSYSNLWSLLLLSPVILLILIGVFQLVIMWKGRSVLGYVSRQSSFLAAMKLTSQYVVRYKYLVLLVALTSILVVTTIMIEQVEREWAILHNSVSSFENRSFSRNLLWMFVFGASGFEDNLFPRSAIGKLLATLFPLIGVGGFITFIGMLTSDHIKVIMQAKGKKKITFSDHIIICGWNGDVPFLVNNLLNENLANWRDIVVLADIDPADFGRAVDSVEFKKSGKKVEFVQGCATQRKYLWQANMEQAAIAVVASDEDTGDKDARNILKVLTIEKYCRELEKNDGRGGRKNIYTIAEIENPENFEAARDAMVDEIVSYEHIKSKLFVQSALNPGVSDFFDEVLTYNDENDIYSDVIEQDSQLEGLTFDQLMVLLRRYEILLLSINPKNEKDNSKEEDNPDTPTKAVAAPAHNGEGPKRRIPKRRVMTNPHGEDERTYRAKAGDRIIVLARNERQVEQAVKRIGQMSEEEWTQLEGRLGVLFDEDLPAYKLGQTFWERLGSSLRGVWQRGARDARDGHGGTNRDDAADESAAHAPSASRKG